MSSKASSTPPAPSPAVFTIPTHRSFADSLAAGLIARFGGDPMGLAFGRILLPNNRAVRTVTEAFVRASGSGLLLPRLVPVGDPDLEERIGGALDPVDAAEPVPPAVDPLTRQLALAAIIRNRGVSSAEALRLAGELGRTLDALLVEEIDARQLSEAAGNVGELAQHWQLSLAHLRAIIEHWPAILAERGTVDLAERRNRLLRGLARRWANSPPPSFTVAAGVTTTAPAVCALLKTIASMTGGMVVLPGLSLSAAMPDEEWDALGPDERGRGDETHPQFHLKVLLSRIGVAREEVKVWRSAGTGASPSARTRVVANAMALAEYTAKWRMLRPAGRRLSGVRSIELPDSAAEAQAIALALRETIEFPGKTAALVTPDRALAMRVSALLKRWGIEADDSAGTPLSQTTPGTLLLAIVAAAAEDLAPVSLLALLKHPLAGGEGEERRRWLDAVRTLDLALRGPRPPGGLDGLDRQFAGNRGAWDKLRPCVEALGDMNFDGLSLAGLAAATIVATGRLAGSRAWSGQEGRQVAELLSELEALPEAGRLPVSREDAVPLLRLLLDERRVRPPYGGHPRVFIWGLLEARLQQADLMILGGMNDGVWPALPTPDPWLAPRIRANLGLPGLDFRIGLSAHDFASALGAPNVLVSRARRDSRSPTVTSRFWLRLQAMTGGMVRDSRLERLAMALDDPGETRPVDRPAPAPPVEKRPRRISVTAVDRLKADPFAFYAQAMLRLRRVDPVDADLTAAWRGTAVHSVLEKWLKEDDCDPARLLPRTEQFLGGEAIHPMLRALWAPRLIEAVRWIQGLEESNRSQGRRPLSAEAEGSAEIAGITVYGKSDRIDQLADGGLAIVDYKTGQPPKQKAVDAGFALQLGMLGLIARAGGFENLTDEPHAFEYWSLVKDRGSFGKVMKPDKKIGPQAFLEQADSHFRSIVGKYLLGDEPFTAKLHPAYAPYGDYDQLMRLEEWYGRQ